jgi:hypothetical protein
MALMTEAASMSREWHVSIKKPLELAHNPPWDGENREWGCWRNGYTPHFACRVPGFYTTSPSPPPSYVHSVSQPAPPSSKNKTPPKSNSGIRDGDHQEKHQQRDSLSAPPRRHDCFGIPNHPTCTKGLSAATATIPVANKVGADRFPACGILVPRPPCGVSRFTPPSPRRPNRPRRRPLHPSHLAIRRRHLCWPSR